MDLGDSDGNWLRGLCRLGESMNLRSIKIDLAKNCTYDLRSYVVICDPASEDPNAEILQYVLIDSI